MSFWDLANGRPTDLDPIPDPSVAKTLAVPAAGVAASAIGVIGLTWATLSGLYPLGAAGGAMARVMRLGGQAADEFADAKADLPRRRAEAAQQRIIQMICYYEKVRARQGSNARVLSRLAVLREAAGHLGAAVSSIDEAIEAAPEDSLLWAIKGRLSSRLERWRDAEAAFRNSLNYGRGDAAIWSALGLAQSKLGNLDEARISWEKGAEASPTSTADWMSLGELAYAIGKAEEGVKCWQRACKLDGSLIPPWQSLCSAAKQQSAAGRNGRAISLLDEALSANSDYVEAWFEKAQCEQKRGNLKGALDAISEALRRDPNNWQWWVSRGDLEYELAETELAIKSWERACSLNPQVPPKWVQLCLEGNTAVKNLDFLEAARKFEQATRCNPRYSPAWVARARCAQMQDKHCALNHLHRALALDDKSAAAWLLNGDLLDALGRKEEARLSWHAAYALDASAAVPWVLAYRRGMEAVRAKEIDSAINCYSRAIHEFPEYADAWFAKGAAHRSRGEDKDAWECFGKVLEIDRHHGLAMLNLGNIEFERGNRESAFRYWDGALSVSEPVVQAAINKGAVLADEGSLAEAAKLFKMASHSGHPVATRALQLCKYYDCVPIA